MRTSKPLGLGAGQHPVRRRQQCKLHAGRRLARQARSDQDGDPVGYRQGPCLRELRAERLGRGEV